MSKKVTFSSDPKLNSVFNLQEDSKAELVKKIKAGYLNGRAITQLMDSLSLDGQVDFHLIKSKLESVDIINKNKTNKFHVVKKLSWTPFWIRRGWHNMRLCSSKYEKKVDQKANILADGYLAKIGRSGFAIESGKCQEPETMFKNASDFRFGDKVFMTPPGIGVFEGEVLTNAQFMSLMKRHRKLFKDSGRGSHGCPYDNLIAGFKNGKGKSSVNGNVPLVLKNPKENKKMHRKLQEVMTLISKKPVSEQMDCMTALIPYFQGCNTLRTEIIDKMHEELLVPNDFTCELQRSIYNLKRALFENMVNEKCPQAALSPWQQPAHMRSGILAATGEDLGLEGVATAVQDVHKYSMPKAEKQKFIREFKKRLQPKLESFCLNLAKEIDSPPLEGGLDRLKFLKWAGAKEADGQYLGGIYYDEDKPAKHYKGLPERLDDHNNYSLPFLTRAQLMQILAFEDYIERSA